MKHDRILAYIAFAIVCVVWGTTYLAIRIAIETIPPLMMIGMRYYEAAERAMRTISEAIAQNTRGQQ